MWSSGTARSAAGGTAASNRIGSPPGALGYSLFVWTPSTRRADDRLALAYRDVSAGPAVLLCDAAWAAVALVSNPDTLDFSQGVDWASLHGKLFIATKSDVNRLHVYSPSWADIRRTGLAPPTAPPTVTNVVGVPQTYFDARAFRTRLTRQVNGVTLLRSEPTLGGPVRARARQQHRRARLRARAPSASRGRRIGRSRSARAGSGIGRSPRTWR